MGKIFLLLALCAFESVSAVTLVEQNLDYSDHRQKLDNPGRGLASHKGFRLHPGKLVNLKQAIVFSDFM